MSKVGFRACHSVQLSLGTAPQREEEPWNKEEPWKQRDPPGWISGPATQALCAALPSLRQRREGEHSFRALGLRWQVQGR